MADHKETARQLQALAEPTRLLVVRHLLAATEACVSDIADALGVPFENLSHHLLIMWRAGVLAGRKAGRKRFYSVSPELLSLPGPEGAPAVLRIGELRVVFPSLEPAAEAA